MNELALFAGIGGGILGTSLIGHKCVCAVENEPYAQGILLARQNDKTLEPFPIWDDVTTFDGTEWRGVVDCVSGGFPCQDISIAGKGKGINGERSGLWGQMARIIGEVEPSTVFIENSPMLTRRGLEKVLFDLAEMGFDAEWGVIGANEIGAPHKRSRIWILARNNKKEIPLDTYSMFDGLLTSSEMYEHRNVKLRDEQKCNASTICTNVPKYTKWWDVEPRLDRVANGVSNRNERIKAIGNAQVPRVASIAYLILWNRLKTK